MAQATAGCGCGFVKQKILLMGKIADDLLHRKKK